MEPPVFQWKVCSEGLASKTLLYCVFFAGVHRQALCITLGWFLGYHLTKIENYKYAKLDREMSNYIRLHPAEFPETGKDWRILHFVANVTHAATRMSTLL